MLLAARFVGRQRISSSSSIFVSSNSSPSSKNINSRPRIDQQEQRRTIYSKYAVPDHAKHNPEPWPYRERGYSRFHYMLDWGVSKRLNENSKLIVVEGNVGTGKSQFAKELADELGFFHVPDAPFDQLFIDSYGDDRRLHYHLFPETCRDFDTRMFYEQPNHRNVAKFQQRRYQCRVEAYMNALAHIMNTGQGVVLERSHHTDKVYVEAMHKKGYLSDPYRWYYHKWLKPRIDLEMQLEAHLVIYLDAPVDKCLENIKKNHKPWEWKNDVMDYTYLESMDRGLKAWLKEYSRHAEILTYDWKDGGDAKTVAEDIERIDLDEFKTHENEKFESWTLFTDEFERNNYRNLVTSKKMNILEWFYIRPPEVEEMWLPIDDWKQRNQVLDMLYGPFAAGFRADRGDSPWEMATTFMRDFVSNKKWTEYVFRDEHHVMGHDLFLYDTSPPPTPTIPDELLEPRSPYKSDGGCMHDHQLFVKDGQLTFLPH